MDKQEQAMFERVQALLFLQNCLLLTILRETRSQETQSTFETIQTINENRKKILGFIRGGNLPKDLDF